MSCAIGAAIRRSTFCKMIRYILLTSAGLDQIRCKAAVASISLLLAGLVRRRRRPAPSIDSTTPAGGVRNIRSRSSRRRIRTYLLKLRQKPPGLKFGLDIKDYIVDSALHPKLYQLLLFLFVNGSSVFHILPLSPIDTQESKELKRALKKRAHLRMCDYGVSAAIAVLKDFLKQLKSPPLELRQWEGIASQLAVFSTSAEIFNLYERCRWQIEQLNRAEDAFLPYLMVTVRNMSLDRQQKYLISDRVTDILKYLGPAILRCKGRKVKKDDVLSDTNLAVLQFLVCGSKQIFGDLQYLFPPKHKTQLRNTFSPTPAFRGPTWFKILGRRTKYRKQNLEDTMFLEALLAELHHQHERQKNRRSDSDSD